MQVDAFFPGDGADFLDRLDGADLVVRMHHRDQHGVFPDGLLYVRRVDQAVGVHRQDT